MEIKATGLPETVEDYQVALNAAFEGGKAYGKAQRTWVGLTDEERGFCINANMGTGLWAMSKDVEAKLKEKNNGT